MAGIRIRPKRRTGSAGVPSVGSLLEGELAVNAFSREIWMRVGANLQLVANAGGDWNTLANKPTNIAYTSGATFTGELHASVNTGAQLRATVWTHLSSNAGGDSLLGNNCYFDYSDSSFRYGSTHPSLGASGIVLRGFGDAGPAFFDTGDNATTQGASFTPTLRKILTDGMSGSPTINGEIRSAGSLGGLNFADRGGTSNWTFYATGGIAYLWNSIAGNLFAFDTSGRMSLRAANGGFQLMPRLFSGGPDPGPAADPGDVWFQEV